jgi:hypothetical protein
MRALLPVAALAMVGFATAATSQMASTANPIKAIVNDQLEISIPDGFRHWTFIGAPLTPNGLNGGSAPFPEFHHVYVHRSYLEAYLKDGFWPEGTTIVKELVVNHPGTYEDGSRDEVSGRGFFAKSFHGIDMMVKDSEKFAATNGWGFYNFGHHALPYEPSAVAMPAENCASCHEDNSHNNMVFTGFYPILER